LSVEDVVGANIMLDTCGIRVTFFHGLDVGELRMNSTQIGKSSRATSRWDL
jgi:hypothetical protein